MTSDTLLIDMLQDIADVVPDMISDDAIDRAAQRYRVEHVKRIHRDLQRIGLFAPLPPRVQWDDVPQERCSLRWCQRVQDDAALLFQR